MLNAVEETTSTQPGQPNASSLQEPRNDLQPTGDTGSSSQTGSPQTVPQVPQDQLRADQLRVGDSANTVQNTTSTTPGFFAGQDYFSFAWLWMIVPIVLAIVLFRPRKAARTGDDTEATIDSRIALESDTAPLETADKSSSASVVPKPKKAKKKKARAKKR